MKFLIRFFLSVVCLFSSTLYANSFYTGVSLMQSTINVAGVTFNPVVPKVRLGYILLSKVMFEMQFSGSSDDNNNNSTMKIQSIRAAYLRLASKPNIDFRIHMLLGFAETGLQVTGNNSFSDNYSGFSWAVLFENRLWSSNSYLTLEYTSFYSNDDVDISGASLGLKYLF